MPVQHKKDQCPKRIIYVQLPAWRSRAGREANPPEFSCTLLRWLAHQRHQQLRRGRHPEERAAASALSAPSRNRRCPPSLSPPAPASAAPRRAAVGVLRAVLPRPSLEVERARRQRKEGSIVADGAGARLVVSVGKGRAHQNCNRARAGPSSARPRGRR